MPEISKWFKALHQTLITPYLNRHLLLVHSLQSHDFHNAENMDRIMESDNSMEITAQHGILQKITGFRDVKTENTEYRKKIKWIS